MRRNVECAVQLGEVEWCAVGGGGVVCSWGRMSGVQR
jgi:hypothetical protein